jgi:hypothetical protein
VEKIMVVFSQCLDCKNYFFDVKEKNCCQAFPNGIADDIFWNELLHTEHIENDNGFKFEPLWEKDTNS